MPPAIDASIKRKVISRELFVDELSKSYDKGWELKNTLESKANNRSLNSTCEPGMT